MKDVGSGIGDKNISDLVLKKIHGIFEIKNPTKEQVNEYKMTKIEKELNTKNNKNRYVRNDVMATIIKLCRGEKNKRYKSN